MSSSSSSQFLASLLIQEMLHQTPGNPLQLDAAADDAREQVSRDAAILPCEVVVVVVIVRLLLLLLMQWTCFLCSSHVHTVAAAAAN